MAAIAADRHLLFGLLALQNGIINQGQLVAAFQAWTLDKAKGLAEHLEARGDLTRVKRTVLEALAEVHLDAHGGDVEKSLAAVSAGKSAREGLSRIGAPEVTATLDHVGSAHGSTEDGDPERTTSYSVGAATSDGQRFQILRPHARGGLGAVFVALDSELHREVALKQILDHHADDPVSRCRFVLEAEVTGGLEHPGIVPVYGLGTHADGRPYYAMRLIKGDSLKEAIAAYHADEGLRRQPGRRSLELRKLLRRFLDVCNAIEFAHSRGVLHRDLKPSNVILGKHGETLVVDWGLAKVLDHAESGPGTGQRPLIPSSASGPAETLAGSMLGTPGYMSPEQAAGELDRLGLSSDVYSLGATLYCLLTGRPPFAGEVNDAFRARPFHPDVVFERGRFLLSRGLASRADDDFIRAYALGKRDPQLLDRLTDSEDLFARACASDPGTAPRLRDLRSHRMAAFERRVAEIAAFRPPDVYPPHDREWPAHLVLKSLADGDPASARSARAFILDEFDDAFDTDTLVAAELNEIAWAAALTPGAVDRLDLPIWFAERAVDRAGAKHRGYYINTLGAVLYRDTAGEIGPWCLAPRIRPLRVLQLTQIPADRPSGGIRQQYRDCGRTHIALKATVSQSAPRALTINRDCAVREPPGVGWPASVLGVAGSPPDEGREATWISRAAGDRARRGVMGFAARMGSTLLGPWR